jgi:hypothetical protein
MHLPLIEKDTIKESLADVMLPEDRAASRQLGTASFRLLHDLAGGILNRGVDLMIEANFTRKFAAPELERLSSTSSLVIVHCEADRQIIERRYRARHASGERHAGHFDVEALPDVLAGLDHGDYDLRSIGHPVHTIETNDGYEPPYAAIVNALEAFRSSD